jgi:uncharacterized protein
MKQLSTFFILTYFFSWVLWLPLYGHIFGLNNLPTSPFQHAIGALGPLMASLLTTFIFVKKEGVKIIFAKCFQIKPLIYFAIALLSPFILALLASLISYFINKTTIDFSGLFTTKEFPQFSPFIFFIYNLVFFGFGEEVGWRGFALPRLQNEMNALLASIVLTLFWALWHLPMFFYKEGFTTMGGTGIFGWIFSLLTGSILLTWLYNSSKGSILICAVFHTTIDIAFTANYADKNIANNMGFLITAWGILTIIILKPKKLAW